MTVLDAYNVHSYGLDERNDVEQLAIQRRDGEAISSLADVQAIREQRAPGARLLIVHLRDREIGALADLIDAHVDVDDDSPAADALRAVRAKLARLPQAVTA
jgi:hypothetical protein